ncbi:hypothetical protein K3G39_16155 [Pontibacter sp. HSC-14F20]|uniref:hypothetical protein n=1 Tax=Pontibacter sp. HSC-14F20 TaxID=2864136 RepID=UPI001C738EF5|nr:hypothetical protein [Pontibacter sp. HSC-14F20]MBX0334775.1 hypothetical protein [Pontibacter sp. HSC-14F20]
MIILEDIATWPQDIIDYITPDIFRIGQERELELTKNLEGKSWLSAIPDSMYVQTQKQLAIMLRSYSIKAYHCTRLINPEKVLKTGLLPLSRQMLAKGLSNVAPILVSTEDSFEAEEELRDFVRSDAFKNQQGLVWVYLTEMQTQQYDCQDLSEYYGGRTLRAALFNKRYKFHPLLKRLGVPVVIACRVQIADAPAGQVEELAKLMLDHLLNDAAGYSARPIMGELSVNTAIPATNIFEVKEQLQDTLL